MVIKRFWQHAFTGKWHVRRLLSVESRREICQCVVEAENGHSGQIRVVIESTPGIRYVLDGCTPRERALEMFARERVWDTQENNGVLLYLLVAERAAEIVADRGLNGRVDPKQWKDLCIVLERNVPTDEFVAAVCEAVRGIGDLLRAAFPADTSHNELPDDVLVR